MIDTLRAKSFTLVSFQQNPQRSSSQLMDYRNRGLALWECDKVMSKTVSHSFLSPSLSLSGVRVVEHWTPRFREHMRHGSSSRRINTLMYTTFASKARYWLEDGGTDGSDVKHLWFQGFYRSLKFNLHVQKLCLCLSGQHTFNSMNTLLRFPAFQIKKLYLTQTQFFPCI